MLRFIKHHLTGIDGVALYPILSLLIFVLFFAVVLTLAMRMKKKEVEELSNIPLDLDNQNEALQNNYTNF